MLPIPLERWLVDEEMLVRVDGTLKPTVAGALTLLDDNETSLGRPGIEILRYSANEKEPDRRQVGSGTADEMVRQAEAIVRRELGRQSIMVGVERVESARHPPVVDVMPPAAVTFCNLLGRRPGTR